MLHYASFEMAKHGKIRTAFEYAAARSMLTLLRSLPPKQAMNVGMAFGRTGYFFASDLRRTAQINLRMAFPGKTDHERDQMVRRCFESLGRLLGIFPKMTRESAEALMSVVDYEGLHNAEAALREGRGVIFYTAHLGAWELTSYVLSLLGYPFTVLARRIENPRIETLVDRHRTAFGNASIDKMAAARAMIKIIRSGEGVGVLWDLNTLDDEGIFVDFFGVPASTNFVVGKLAVRTGALIVPAFAPWDATRGKYLLSFHEPIRPQTTGDEEADVRAVTTTVTRIIEDQIRLYPEQWLWVHKRWKTRPPGEPPIY